MLSLGLEPTLLGANSKVLTPDGTYLYRVDQMYEKLLLFRDYYYTYSHSLQVLGSGRVDCYTFIIRVLGLSTTYLYILLVLYLVGILKEK